MPRNIKITFKSGKCLALNAQKSGIYPYGFPFTLNPLGDVFSAVRLLQTKGRKDNPIDISLKYP